MSHLQPMWKGPSPILLIKVPEADPQLPNSEREFLAQVQRLGLNECSLM